MPDPADGESTVGRWLALLRDGTEEERQLARTELGLILEARGLLDDAFEAYERNVEDGVADRRPYERLAALAHARGDSPTEARALRALADLIAPPPSPPAPPPEPQSTAPQVIAPPRSASRPGRPLRIVLTALALPILIVLAGALVVQTNRPIATPTTVPTATPTVPAIVASPAAVELRLAADVPLPLPSPTATLSPTHSPIPTLTPTPLPARCADAELRFPETRDSEAAVRAAYRDFLARQGVTLGAGDALFTGLAEAYATRHAEVVAGWIGVTLQRERRGLPAFSLPDYVASDVIVATGPGEYQYRATISPQGWAEIRSWPASTCEGAFIRNPANARWVELMAASVGDITWALPTAQPTR